MHGIIFNQFYKFIREQFGQDSLDKITKDSGLGLKFYDATKSHPDEEIQALVDSASKVLRIEKDVALEEFGKFITPTLLKTYQGYIKEHWDCFDLIEHVENTMHKVVRQTDKEAAPPKLDIVRDSDRSIIINYTSKRKMMPLGIGIIKAIAEHYGQKVSMQMEPLKDGTKLKIKAA